MEPMRTNEVSVAERLQSLLARPLPGLSVQAPDLRFCTLLQAALNDSYAEHSEFLSWARPFTSEDEARASLLRAVEEFGSAEREKKLFIFSEEHRALIGCIGLRPTRRQQRYCIGYWAHSAHAGKGHMRRALVHVLQGCAPGVFYLSTSAANASSQRLAEATGFSQMKRLPAHRHCERHGMQDTLVYRFDSQSGAGR